MTSLHELRPGQKAKIVDMALTCRTATRLREMGLIEGAQVERLRSAPFGDPVEYFTCGFRLALRKTETRNVFVQLVEG